MGAEGMRMKKKAAKTNALRLLDRAKIPYEVRTYPHEEGVAVDGVNVARSLGQEPGSVFKTLVTRGGSGSYYVFDVPVAEELDLKKCASAAQGPCRTPNSSPSFWEAEPAEKT